MAMATQEVTRTHTHPEILQPLLTVIRLLLAKHEIDELMVVVQLVLHQAEWDHVNHHVQEVITSV